VTTVNFKLAAERRWSLLAFPLLVGVVLVGAPTIAAADEQTHVRISGPRSDWHPRPRWLLEIGDKEWVIDGSRLVTAVTDLPTTVVIRELGECRTLFSFTARDRGPGDGYQVWYEADGGFRVESTTAFNDGPYGVPSPGNRCPDLPDTSTAGAGGSPADRALASVVDWILSAIGRLF